MLVFHLRPAALPGGFIGVDLFFVISGFLITSSLVSEAISAGRIDVPRFWGRRIRRLIPAAAVVLVFVVMGIVLVMPMTRWPALFGEVIASAFSFQNWVLVSESVNYLTPGVESPVQHFWSLSVEEQYYLVAPFIIWGAAAVAGRLWGRIARTVGIVLGILFAASLAYSVIATAASPSTAYFSTFTRAWELTVGAGLAVVLPRFTVTRGGSRALYVVGAGLLGASLLLITTSTPFPSGTAALPTLAAAALIAAGAASRPSRLGVPLRIRPIIYLGDLSYSLYLWHWPIIVFAGVLVGNRVLPLWGAMAVSVVSLVCADLSRRYIEQPFQTHGAGLPGSSAPASRRIRRHPGVIAAVSLGTVVAMVIAANGVFTYRSAIDAAAASPENYPGYELEDPAFDRASFPDLEVPPIPTAADLQEIPEQFTAECLSRVGEAEVTRCAFGDPNGSRTIVLAGDSHAAMLVPTFDRIGQERGWRVELIAKGSCPLSVRTDVVHGDGRTPFKDCMEWNIEAIQRIVDLHPTAVVTSAVAFGYPDNVQDLAAYDREVAAGYAGAYAQILAAGIPVVAVKETPAFLGLSVPECLNTPGQSSESCSARMEAARDGTPSRIALAVEQEPRVPIIDIDEVVCPASGCRAVIGNMLTLRDDNHLSSQFASSIAWFVEERLEDVEPSWFQG